MMVSFANQKILFAAILLVTMIGSIVGVTNVMKSVPATGYFSASTLGNTITSNSLEEFVESVYNGNGSQIVGIYVPEVLAKPVRQQPRDNAGYVTRNPGETTQFAMARQYGTVGILAHNDLAGSEFYNIQLGQYAIVVYGDGRLEYYLIREVQKYQALSPTSTYSDFLNLDGSQELLNAADLFNRIYSPGSRLVFQTCIEADGDPSWGRMFIIAEPATSQVLSVVQQTSFLLQFTSFGMAAR
jgi:hypothetical protein